MGLPKPYPLPGTIKYSTREDGGEVDSGRAGLYKAEWLVPFVRWEIKCYRVCLARTKQLLSFGETTEDFLRKTTTKSQVFKNE